MEKKLKKQFITYWSEVEIEVKSPVHFSHRWFFRMLGTCEKKAVFYLPEAIPYAEMSAFAGKRTRVTIEVI